MKFNLNVLVINVLVIIGLVALALGLKAVSAQAQGAPVVPAGTMEILATCDGANVVLLIEATGPSAAKLRLQPNPCGEDV